MKRPFFGLEVLLAAAVVLAACLAMAKTKEPGPARAATEEGETATHLAPRLSPPSPAIFPPQSIPLHFDHERHLARGTTCATCHPGAKTSASAEDHLTPRGTACDGCHGSNHTSVDRVVPGGEAMGACSYCHEGWRQGDGNRVAPLDLPRANLHFDHSVHVARNIACAQCHENVAHEALATRDDLPRMVSCLHCHDRPDAESQGLARGACDTCHLRAPFGEAGQIRTRFATGTLFPPAWMHDAAHTPDFLVSHKRVAGNDSEFCGTCHKDDFCIECHDGRVRPRNVHPNDYLNMHATEAQLATQKCTSCHNQQSFCVGCHQRTGVSQSGPPAFRETGRFHPPKEIWSDPVGPANLHSPEARRNLDTCVSCHIERDCVACHGVSGIGAGFRPHPAGFASTCGRELHRNPRPCLVCHGLGDSKLDACR